MANKVILVGRVGQDPEVRHLENGNQVANFSLATNEYYKNRNGERVNDTDWHNIVAWGKIAEIVEMFVTKGTPLYVVGKLKTRSWESDNGKRYITEVIINELEMLGSKKEQEQETSDVYTNDAGELPVDDTDDLPF